MKATWVLLPFGVAMAGAGTLGYVASTKASSEITHLRADIDALAVKLDGIGRETPGALDVLMDGAPGADVAARDPGLAAEAHTPPRAPRPPARRGTRVPVDAFSPLHDALEASFLGEPTDGAWASDARRTASTTLAAALPSGSRIESVECHVTLCRVRTTHPNAARSDDFAAAALGGDAGPAWNGEMALGLIDEAMPGGAVTMVTYLGRDGRGLPLPMNDADR